MGLEAFNEIVTASIEDFFETTVSGEWGIVEAMVPTLQDLYDYIERLRKAGYDVVILAVAFCAIGIYYRLRIRKRGA